MVRKSKGGVRTDRLAVVLVSTRNPLNIGAAARAMSNFGFSDLRTVNPYDLAFREAKSAVGAADVLAHARVFTSVADAIADCSLVVGTTAARNRQLEHGLKSLPQAAPSIRRTLGSGRVAVLFGSEKRGLSNHDFSYCDWLMRISTVDSAPAMNLGQAVALCLYEVARDGRVAKANAPTGASAAELDLLTSILLDGLRASGYAKSNTTSAEKNVRQLVRRLSLSSDDARNLLGMLRQMQWKMSAG